MGLESELARWTRFAAKGGIGKCTATCDCVAECVDDLMFLKDDEITVLLQLPDKENVFLGYCEGVVGHFSGNDVRFLAKLKVPVKAKRASTASGKSSTPTSDIIGGSSSRRSSTSKTEAETLERRTSQQRRVQIPSRMQQMEDEQQRYPPSMTFSSSSTGTDSVVTTPAISYFSCPEIKKSSIYGTPSPRDAHFFIEPPRSKSMPPTRASSPPTVSVSRSLAVMPPPFNLTPSTPLRINKRSPSGSQSSPDPSELVFSPPPSSSVPDTSYSTYDLHSKRNSIGMSDTEVGIGLSLLQDLADGMDSDSDSDNVDDQWPKPDEDTPEAGTLDSDSYVVALSRVGHRDDSFDEGTTVDGLDYCLSEEGHEEKGEGELAGTGKHGVFDEDMASRKTSAITSSRASPNPSIYSNAKPSHNPSTSLPSSISPSFSQSSFSPDERRPSLVPSATSTTEWEGASDIYDDYRYSRFSMASKMSRFSSPAGCVPATPPLPDSHSIERARTDSNKSRHDSSSVGTRPRTDSMSTRLTVDSSSTGSETKVAGGGSLLSTLPLLPEASEGQEQQGSQQQQDLLHDLHVKRTTAILKERTKSTESANSVYSRSSQDAAPTSSGSNDNTHFHTSSTTNTNNHKGRPTPLSFSRSDVVKSPLLHTAWGTPLSSPMPSVDGPSSAGSGTLDFHSSMVGLAAGTSPSGIASALRQRLETERQTPTPEQTQNQRLIRNPSDRKSFMQRDGLGRQIVVEDEEELPSRILDTSGSTLVSTTMTASPEPIHDEDEDDNEQGRRWSFLNSSSPDPDLMTLRTHLGDLTVTNKTPSPSLLEDPSDEFRASTRAAELAEEEEEEREREDEMEKESSSLIIPTPPPLNDSTQTSPIPPTSSPPHISAPTPRLRSTSGTTTRTGSPPIDFRPPLALSDIREPGGPLIPGSDKRRSLFLPHPNAPKSGVTAAGPGLGVPMYIVAQQQQSQQARGLQQMMMPPRPNVIGVIMMALSVPPRVAMVQGQGPPGQGPAGQRSPLMMRGPTIYGRTESDLTGSMGPVPIMFSIDPPHAAFSPPPSNPIPTSLPPSIPVSKPTMASPRAPMQMMAKQQPQSESEYPSRHVSLTGAGAGAPVVGASVSNVGPSARDGYVAPAVEPEAAGGGLIPRAKNFPKPPGLRPRSRSFSSFNSANAQAPIPVQRSGNKAETPSGRDVKRSLTSSVSCPQTSLSLSSSPPSGFLRHASGVQPIPRAFTSPLAQSTVAPPSVEPPASSMGMSASRSTLNETLPPPPSPARPIPIPRPAMPGSTTGKTENFPPPPTRPIPIPRPTLPGSTATGSSDTPPPPRPSSSPPQSHRMTSIQAQSKNDTPSRTSDVDAVSINSDTRSQLVSPSFVRQTSLRTKLSLPNLRRNRSKHEDDSGGGDSEMLQVQDMEFELVKPNFAHFQASARASEDSGVLGKDHSPIDVRQHGNAFLRAESPTISTLSAGSKQSPSMSEPPAGSSWGPRSTSTPVSRATTDTEFSMDAHRNREIKWMSLMSSSPASQARKSKKVRKLVMDGVPSSVRYLVWSYLTDGKARCVSGVYARLCSRGRVPSSVDIERDIRNCFQDQPHLQGTQGPVLLLLQAYLNMVPDIQYTRGLTLIVGQLLLLAPEEDAFWIFISIMDTHIRPYFSTVTTQMEVDSALFSRALESIDGQVARKILVDLGILPATICQPWFSSLFVGTLPPEYLNRVWDLFLFEGIPFLLRVALAIVTRCRLAILACTSEEKVLQIFHHPPPSLLPPSPDAFLTLVCSVKLKDDDVRKQRIKMEAQVKRQTQTPRTISTAGGISLPRT